MIAFNIGDLAGLKEDIGVRFLVLSVLDEERTFDVDPSRIDGIASPLRDDIGKEREEAIIAILRTKFPKNKLRIYSSATGKAWKRI